EGLALDPRDGGDRRHVRSGRIAGRLPPRGGRGVPIGARRGAPRVTRIAVDGIDCAGKSTLANRLGELLQATRLTVDDFLRPPEDRYAREFEPEGYYRDSFDNEAFRAAVLAAAEPLVA